MRAVESRAYAIGALQVAQEHALVLGGYQKLLVEQARQVCDGAGVLGFDGAAGVVGGSGRCFSEGKWGSCGSLDGGVVHVCCGRGLVRFAGLRGSFSSCLSRSSIRKSDGTSSSLNTESTMGNQEGG